VGSSEQRAASGEQWGEWRENSERRAASSGANGEWGMGNGEWGVGNGGKRRAVGRMANGGRGASGGGSAPGMRSASTPGVNEAAVKDVVAVLKGLEKR
jgi:hypothetical protein